MSLGIGDLFSGMPIIGTALDALGTLQQQDFQSTEATSARNWQEYMSATAYQRTVQDMKKAGLNPMLAYHQGATGAPGAAAAGTGATFRSPANMMTAAQIKNLNADTEQKEAEAARIRDRTGPEAGLIRVDIDKSRAAAEQLQASAAHHRASAEQARQMAENLAKLRDKIAAETNLTTQLGNEAAQRVKANLPEINRILRELEKVERQLAQPGLYNQKAAQESLTGLMGAYLKALIPISGSIGVHGSHRD